MPKVDLSENEIFTLHAAIEHLRGGIPEDEDNRARRSDAAFRIASNLEKIAKKASTVSDETDKTNELRKALYELVYVSFPPVGADVPELVSAHHKAVRDACSLLGINPRPTAT